MTKVYVVTEGQYSDFGIKAIFSTKENAERYIAAFNEAKQYNDLNGIDEWELDTDLTVADRIERGEKYWRVSMDRNGNSDIDDAYYPSAENDITLYRGATHISANVWAENEEGAAKIVNEWRLQKIASGEWS